MCLLDEAVRWDANTIECRAVSHRDRRIRCARADSWPQCTRSNTQRRRWRCTAHWFPLAADRPSRPGYIGAVRAVQLHAARLDEAAEALTIRVERLAGDASHVLYAFTVCAGERALAEGRISVALGAAA